MTTPVGPVCCPVCTLFMREGISLESHLNTHPKDQVIDALVRYCITGPNVADNPNATESVPTSQDGQNQHNQSILECTPAHIPSTQYPAFGSSHFTAAITYQQFLSSNATAAGAVIPQYVSVPTILATPNPAHGETHPSTIMPVLYNPYLMQQQQQQVQFYNSVRTQPTQQPLIRQVIPSSVPSSSSIFPVSQQMTLDSNCAPVNNCSVSSTSTVLQVSQNTQTNISSSSSSSLLHVAQVSSPVPENNGGNHSAQDQDTSSSQKDDSVPSPRSPVSNVAINSNKEQRTVGVATSTESDDVMVLEGSQDSLVVPSNSTYCSVNGTQTNSTSCKELSECRIPEQIPASPKEENAVSEVRFDKEEEGCKEDSRRNSPMCPELSMKTDLNHTNTEESHKSSSECLMNCAENQTEDDHSLEINFESNLRTSGDLSISEVIKNGEEAAGLSDIMGVSFVVPLQQETDDHAEYIISDLSYPEQFNSDSNQHTRSTLQVLDSQKRSLNTDDDTEEVVDFDSTQQVNVIEIDGMHIYVPSQLLENSPEVMDRKVTVIQCASSLPFSTSDNSVKADQGSSKPESMQTLMNLDMQTDELMPPRGELSEQESIGGNDSSMWPQNFHDRDEDVSTSYDLLARESWEASDGSDVEAVDYNLSTENRLTKESPPEPVTSPVVEVKKKEKITVGFKCWTCNESFNCPKERRVHHSTKHGRGGITSKTHLKSKSKSSQLVGGNQISKIKEESPDQNVPSEQNNSTKFAQVFVEFTDHQDQTVGDDVKDKDDTSDSKLETEVPDNSVLRYSCSRCDASFVTVKCLQRHIRSTHKNHKFKHRCGICKETFSSDSLYHAHLKIHPLECIRCGKYFYRRQNLNLHIKRHLGIKPYKCAICDKAFVTKQKLAEHTNCHTGNAPIKCSLCNETFRRYSNLIQHKNRYHLKRKKKIKDFICTCGEVFHSKKKLEWHKEIHDEKPKSCTFCSERFVHASSLTRHVRHAHDKRYVPKIGREKENVECPVCSCVFLKSSLQVHMRVHNGERPFPCHICAKGFTTKWNLQLHRWTHASRSSKPFKCSLCKSAFFRRADYTSHMHSHRNERPYTCNYCGCQFIRKYNCLRHVKEHETVKSFSCNVCNKTFHRSYYLKEHMRIHSGVRPFACHICGKASSTKSNHNKHVKIHHAREPVNTEG